MSKFKGTIRSPHIHVALAAGISIVGMACLSKYVLPEPLGYLDKAILPFVATVFEAVYSKNKNKPISRSFYWVIAIFIVAGIVIAIHL